MKQYWLTAIVAFFISYGASSQTLFTYGKYKVDAPEFIRAFNKNNQQPDSVREKAMRDYLDLYINSRLKIRQAYDLGYDTLPQLISEVQSLRNQVLESYMTDPRAVDRLAKEAFERSQKDIHAGYIFIAVSPHGDSAAALAKMNSVLTRLDNKEDFSAVAIQLSDDPGAKQTQGDLGYITVFSLPYEFENIIYATPAGSYSKPFRTEKGYHIFKNIEERNALGKIRIQQILLAFPPDADDPAKLRLAILTDSLYKRILAGEDFGRLAATFSNDVVSAASNGNVPEISVGQYSPAFEQKIWSLPEDGAVSTPFLTDYGYHIVKRIAVKPVVTDPGNMENMEELKDRVKRDDRWKTATDFIYTAVREKGGFQKYIYNDPVLWALSDSLLDYKPAGIGKIMNASSPLFRIGESVTTVADWIRYAQMNRYKRDGTGTKPYSSLMDEFVKNTLYQYYRDHLEELNEEFRNQMVEFKEGNLFFEIMQREVWNKTQTDTTALKALYEKNKSKYNWKQSVDAINFYCLDENTAKMVAEKIKSDPTSWRKVAESMSERITADSTRFEWSQVPGLNSAPPQEKTTTVITVNPNDNTASFAYVIKTYTTASPRSFEEARGLVMNDYQDILEEEWTRSLKKKYPVKVNQKTLNDVLKK